MTKSCPSCGASASGKFCSQCGSSLQTERICECGNRIPPDGRFCNMCGRPASDVAAAARPAAAAATASTSRALSEVGGRTGAPLPRAEASTSAASPSATAGRLPLVIGALAAAVVIAVILIPGRGSDPAPPVANAPGTGAAAGDPRNIDLTSMTPEDAATRLFTRVIMAAEAGDTAEARTFAPMAIDAYGLIPELTLDHRYDLAMIHFVNGNTTAAAAQADTILTAYPAHLFGLAAAAEAAVRTGDTDAARAYYQRFLDSYDSELANSAAEYEMHPPLPAAMRMAAIAYLEETN